MDKMGKGRKINKEKRKEGWQWKWGWRKENFERREEGEVEFLLSQKEEDKAFNREIEKIGIEKKVHLFWNIAETGRQNRHFWKFNCRQTKFYKFEWNVIGEEEME